MEPSRREDFGQQKSRVANPAFALRYSLEKCLDAIIMYRHDKKMKENTSGSHSEISFCMYEDKEEPYIPTRNRRKSVLNTNLKHLIGFPPQHYFSDLHRQRIERQKKEGVFNTELHLKTEEIKDD